MVRAIDCARSMIHLAMFGAEPDPLTHLRLHKLLYYAQGWSLVQRGQPLFEDRIEAWPQGPVVPAVYHVFRERGGGFLLPEGVEESPTLPGEERDFLASVWEAFRGYSATRLREMTDQEPPWRDARRGLGPDERGNREITHEVLEDFFSQAD